MLLDYALAGLWALQELRLAWQLQGHDRKEGPLKGTGSSLLLPLLVLLSNVAIVVLGTLIDKHSNCSSHEGKQGQAGVQLEKGAEETLAGDSSASSWRRRRRRYAVWHSAWHCLSAGRAYAVAAALLHASIS